MLQRGKLMQRVLPARDQIPFYSRDPFVLKSLERFRENEVAGVLRLLESDNPKFSATVALLNGHYPKIF